jgi:ketosteroid isomerase-like protein
VDAFEDYWAEATEFVDAGQHVVVGVRHRGRGKASGIEVDMPQFQVYTLRDGRIIRYRGFRTRAEALGAAGIPD